MLVFMGIKLVFFLFINVLYGDIGIVGFKDIVVVFFKSGVIEEFFKLVLCVCVKGVYIVGVFFYNESMVVEFCDMYVYLFLECEFCFFDLVLVIFIVI